MIVNVVHFFIHTGSELFGHRDRSDGDQQGQNQVLAHALAFFVFQVTFHHGQFLRVGDSNRPELGDIRKLTLPFSCQTHHNENTMQKTEKFFIFSWKELTVIALLILISIGFFFTLGLHYGKKLHPEMATAAVTENASKLEESPETLPPRETLEEGSQHSASATEDAIKSTTEEEVGKAELKVDSPKPVDLPSEKKGEKKAEEPKAEASEAAPDNKFGIQLGSYPAKKEAQLKVKALMKRGLHPDIRTAVVAGQTRYRVVLAGFKTHSLADQKAKDLKAKRKIENFVVIKTE
jgi:cell division septation protein DedD